MPSRQIIGQTITYNEATAASKSSPDGTQHSEWPCHCEHGPALGAHRISYVRLRKDACGEVLCNMHNACRCAS